ncbi:nuclear transport factor 2 family protein [Pseudonocardia sp. DSM 110487]|uniref:nuclear transport factor 2 family protein n=1 Tax=Pseudonocardia sp. DSM 110487 TaxID=2865833 RepID=UPI001C6A62CB|nr:nuclear transport factor 2 family protein [Pseudonocardia sp. DSM 110487]QYN35455.1 nuclear transport factor 2 family protein [Pseudonocardia sp. DSM 110487]
MRPEDEVLAAAAARADALARGDADALRARLHPLFGWTSHRGDTFDREAYVRRNTEGDVRWHGQTLEDVRVVVVGDTAVLRCTAVDRIEADGPQIFRMPMTQTWTHSAEGWLCLAGHAGPRVRPARSGYAGM